MSAILRDCATLPTGLVVERTAPPGRRYVISTPSGVYVAGFSFRDVLTLSAVRHGHARAVWRRRNAGPWGFSDEYLEAECDVFGIGWGQLTKFQENWPAGAALVTKPKVVGLLELTDHGNALLDAVESLDGVEAFADLRLCERAA